MREKDLALKFDRGKMHTKEPHWFCPLTYLKIRLRNNAKTCPSRRCYFIFWGYSYPFWRHLFTTILLQAIGITKTITSLSSVSPAQQSIHNRRGDVGANLPNLPGVGSDRILPSIKAQRGLPIPHGIAHLSKPVDLEALPSSYGSFGTPQIEEISRPAPLVNDPKTQPSLKTN